MPELAEVEYYRRQWDTGVGGQITGVDLHARNRVFRETNTRAMAGELRGARLIGSRARGKQMLFEFSNSLVLGIHLGMSGTLRVEGPDFEPGKHDHLVLRQRA